MLILPVGLAEEPQDCYKEPAQLMGIILPGFDKEEVIETLGWPRKQGRSITNGLEAWYYKAPEEQIIYFKEDEVVEVKYKTEQRRLFYF